MTLNQIKMNKIHSVWKIFWIKKYFFKKVEQKSNKWIININFAVPTPSASSAPTDAPATDAPTAYAPATTDAPATANASATANAPTSTCTATATTSWPRSWPSSWSTASFECC